MTAATPSADLPADLATPAGELVAHTTVWRLLQTVPSRARDLPADLRVALDRLLDRLVHRVVEQPMDVRNADEARLAVEAAQDATGRARTTIQLLGASRLARRTIKLGRRSIPGVTILAASTGLATSVAMGVRELSVLASFVVHRLREAGIEPEAALVRNLTLEAYTRPGGKPNPSRPTRLLHARLFALWVRRSLVDAVPVLGTRMAQPDARRWVDAIARLELRPAGEELRPAGER